MYVFMDHFMCHFMYVFICSFMLKVYGKCKLCLRYVKEIHQSTNAVLLRPTLLAGHLAHSLPVRLHVHFSAAPMPVLTPLHASLPALCLLYLQQNHSSVLR